MDFHGAFSVGNRREALDRLHGAVLMVRGQIATAGEYRSYRARFQVDDGPWRPEIISIGQELRPDLAERADQWLTRARELLGKDLVGSASIATRLKRTDNLGALLSMDQASDIRARSIHDAKGLEFPAMCVVLSPRTGGKIIDVLVGTSTGQKEIEETRKYMLPHPALNAFLPSQRPGVALNSSRRFWMLEDALSWFRMWQLIGRQMQRYRGKGLWQKLSSQ